MSERVRPEILDSNTMVQLAREAVSEANDQNPNALGLIIHGSRANEGQKVKKQPGVSSDVDIITVRKDRDKAAAEVLASQLWEKLQPRFGIQVDTGMWGSLEWEDVLEAMKSQAARKQLQRQWKLLRESPIIVISANPDTEEDIKKVLFG